jgi:hypothetical protein
VLKSRWYQHYLIPARKSSYPTPSSSLWCTYRKQSRLYDANNCRSFLRIE